MSTVDWEDEVSTKFQMENYSSEVTTASAQRSSMMPSYLIPFKMAVVAVGVLGILTNGVVLACFCIAGRSKMNSSSFHIANHTTLELFGAVFTTVKFVMDLAGVLEYYEDTGPANMAKCILIGSATLITLGAYGGIVCMVIITLDRFWKIVYPIHHRKHYRPWMLKVGLFLPWLNGIAVDLLPAVGTSGIINGKCYPLIFWPSVLMRKVCLLCHSVDLTQHLYIFWQFMVN